MTEGVTHIIKEDTGVQALIGQNKSGSKYKVYPGICDQPEQWPYTVVKIISKIPFLCKNQSPTRFTYTFVVITYHKNYLEAQEIDKQIFWALDNTTGVHNGVTIVAMNFQDLNDEVVNPGGTLLHAKVSKYQAIVNEGQAT